MIRYLFTALALIMLPSLAAAQTNIALGGINADPTQAVEIASDSLTVDQDTGQATFEGNVVIGQGDLRIAAGTVQVIYDEASGDIAQLEARGGVTFVTATEAAEAQTAIYDLAGGQLVLSGEVLLTQGNSAISAERMTINLETGAARMEGRVRTSLQQGGN